MAVQDCPGQYPVSFHYVEPVQQYWLEYLLHTARVHKVQESKDLEVQDSLFDDGKKEVSL